MTATLPVVWPVDVPSTIDREAGVRRSSGPEVPIDRFAPIDLDELLATAALQDRVDRKYLLPRSQLTTVLRRLRPSTRALQIDGQHEFGYESVYFDTPDVQCYRQAALRRRSRYKIRTRGYLDTGDRFIEVKVQDGRGRTVKQRQSHAGAADEFDLAAREFADHVVVSAAMPGTWGLDLRSTLISRYRRTTLLLPDSGSRVTVDTDLSWSLPDGTTLSRPGLVVVETKTAGRACHADQVLWRAGIRPLRLSKYGTGLAALRPGLPSTVWHRTLRRYFWSS